MSHRPNERKRAKAANGDLAQLLADRLNQRLAEAEQYIERICNRAECAIHPTEMEELVAAGKACTEFYVAKVKTGLDEGDWHMLCARFRSRYPEAMARLLLCEVEVEMPSPGELRQIYFTMMSMTAIEDQTRVRRAMLRALGVSGSYFFWFRDHIFSQSKPSWWGWYSGKRHASPEVGALRHEDIGTRIVAPCEKEVFAHADLTSLRTPAILLRNYILHFASTREELCNLLTHRKSAEFFAARGMEDFYNCGRIPGAESETNVRVAAFEGAMLAVAYPKGRFNQEAMEKVYVEMAGLLPKIAWENAKLKVVHRSEGHDGLGVMVREHGTTQRWEYNLGFLRTGRSSFSWILWMTTLAFATYDPQSFPFVEVGRLFDNRASKAEDLDLGPEEEDVFQMHELGPFTLKDGWFDEKEEHRRLRRSEVKARLWKLWTLSTSKAATSERVKTPSKLAVSTSSGIDPKGRWPFVTLTRDREEECGWLRRLYGMEKPHTPWQRSHFHWHMVWLWLRRIRPYAVFWAETAAAAVMERHERLQKVVASQAEKDADMEFFDDKVQQLAEEEVQQRHEARIQAPERLVSCVEYRREKGAIYYSHLLRWPTVEELNHAAHKHAGRLQDYQRKRLQLPLGEHTVATRRLEAQEVAEDALQFPRKVKLCSEG